VYGSYFLNQGCVTEYICTNISGLPVESAGLKYSEVASVVVSKARGCVRWILLSVCVFQYTSALVMHTIKHAHAELHRCDDTFNVHFPIEIEEYKSQWKWKHGRPIFIYRINQKCMHDLVVPLEEQLYSLNDLSIIIIYKLNKSKKVMFKTSLHGS